MTGRRLHEVVAEIVETTHAMLATHLPDVSAQVSYCAIFSRDQEEFDGLKQDISPLGRLANDTATGPVYVVPAIATVAGEVRVVKIRLPDATRTERGDADYAAVNYEALRATVIGREGYRLVMREEFEMIELIDRAFDARVYFSHPPVEQHAGVREALAALRTYD